MGDQYSEAAVKLGQYIAPALDREVTDEGFNPSHWQAKQ